MTGESGYAGRTGKPLEKAWAVFPITEHLRTFSINKTDIQN